MRRWLALGGVAFVVALAGCGGDDKKTSTSPATTSPAAPQEVESPDGTAAPPAGAGQLPPEFTKCMADQGYEVKSPADIHSAPPDVLQTCFGALHGDVP